MYDVWSSFSQSSQFPRKFSLRIVIKQMYSSPAGAFIGRSSPEPLFLVGDVVVTELVPRVLRGPSVPQRAWDCWSEKAKFNLGSRLCRR